MGGRGQRHFRPSTHSKSQNGPRKWPLNFLGAFLKNLIAHFVNFTFSNNYLWPYHRGRGRQTLANNTIFWVCRKILMKIIYLAKSMEYISNFQMILFPPREWIFIQWWQSNWLIPPYCFQEVECLLFIIWYKNRLWYLSGLKFQKFKTTERFSYVNGAHAALFNFITIY